MATPTTWNAGSGNWFTAANWDEPNPNPPPATLREVPDADNDVAIPNNFGTTPFTVTYAGTSIINTLNGSDTGLLAITSGALTILNGSAANGMAIDLAAGAALTVAAGTLTTTGGTYAGTVGGLGTLFFRGGTYDLDAGLSLSIANWIIGVTSNGNGAFADLNTNLTYAGAFTLQDFSGNPATLALNGNTLTLSGSAVLDGRTLGSGSVLVTGTATVSSGGFAVPVFAGGAVLQIGAGGSTVQHGTAILGDATTTGTLRIDPGGSYTIDASANLVEGAAGNAILQNAGSLAVTGAGTQASIIATLTGAGSIDVGAGAKLTLRGAPTLSGTVSGAGTLAFGFGTTALIDTTAVTVAAMQLAGGNGGAVVTLAKNLTYAGQLSFTNQFDSIDLGGRTLTLSGTGNALLGNAIDGGGTLRVTGAAILGGNLTLGNVEALTLRNSGTVTQSGSVFSRSSILNDAGRDWTIATAGNIADLGGAAFTNNGTLTVSAAGSSSIAGSITNTGTISVGAGATLTLNGTKTLGGMLTGAGALVLGSGSAALNTAVGTAALTIGGAGTTTLGIDLTYAGAFTLEQFATLALAGNDLTLTGRVIAGGTFAGSAGIDRIIIESALVDLSGMQLQNWTTGTDSIAIDGTAGADSIRGSGLGDAIAGGKGADTLEGQNGADTLDGGKGADSMVGGSGNDLFIVDNAADQAIEAEFGGQDTVQASVSYTLGDWVEELVLTGAAKNGTGSAQANRITGNDGRNSLSGAAGNDTLEGGDGADLLDGGGGADSMVGGTGNDSYVVDDAGDVVLELSGGGTDEVRSSLASYTIGAEVENLTLLAGGVNGTGNAANNTVSGNGAANVLSGLDGRDLLVGGGGDDTLLGGAAADTLEGGGGRDRMDGGAGADLFRWLSPGQGRDTIAGFSAAEDDLAFSAGGFGGGLVAGVALTAAQLELNTTGVASTAAVRFVLHMTTGVLSFDADGSGGGANATIVTFQVGVPVLTTADFVIIA